MKRNDRVLGRRARLRLALAGLLLLAWGAAFPAIVADPASADTSSSGADLSVAQTLDGQELTIILRRVTGTPGPLRVDIVSHAGTLVGTLTVALTPPSTAASDTVLTSGRITSRGRVVMPSQPGLAGTTLTVDRPGPRTVLVSDGVVTARIPFVVPAQVSSPAETTALLGFVFAGLLMLVSVVVAVRARAGWVPTMPLAGVVAALAVAITASALSAVTPSPPLPGLSVDATAENVSAPYAAGRPAVGDPSRPPLTLTSAAPASAAGTVSDLVLHVDDSATGLPADDLIVHDGAIMHLLVVGPTGSLWHLHPVLVSSGVFDVRVVFPDGGVYAVSAELERVGGGVQLVRLPVGIAVLGSGAATMTPRPRLGGSSGLTGSVTVGGIATTVSASGLSAGAPTVLAVKVGNPSTMQPWLGMLGHLIVVGPLDPGERSIGAQVLAAPTWSHAHSMGDMSWGAASGSTGMSGMSGMSGIPSSGSSGMGGLVPVNGDSAPDETVAAFGPKLAFGYVFPRAGTYLAWIQVERDYAIITIPLDLEVGSAGSTG